MNEPSERIPDFIVKGLLDGEPVSTTEAIDLLQMMAVEIQESRSRPVLEITPEAEIPTSGPPVQIPWIALKAGQESRLPLDYSTALFLDAILKRLPNYQVTVWDDDIRFKAVGLQPTIFAWRSHDNGTTIRIEWK